VACRGLSRFRPITWRRDWGDSVDTVAVFDVPKGTDVESIELHDGPFSEGVTVGL
jgi:hypothetical protein